MTGELPKPTFLSAPTIATLCGVTRNTVCAWIRQGKLSSYQTAGGKNLIRPTDLITFMREHHMFVPEALEEMAERDEHAVQAAQEERTTTTEPSILVVDDDSDARKLAMHSLKKLDMPLLEAESGYEALHLLLKHPETALIILDIMMPGQPGTQTLVELRQQNMGMPVIVVSGYSPDALDKLFGGVQPDLIIPKPYRPAELLESAQTLLAEAAAA